jgi:hypothetical protein
MARNADRSIVACVLLFMLSGSAGAAPVSVTGGFSSFSGVVLGEFFTSTINGVRVCPGNDCDEFVGPASVTFPATERVDFANEQLGLPPNTPNAISFTPAEEQNVTSFQPFVLGTMSFTNGIWSGDADFGFSLTTVSTDPALNGHVFSDTLRMLTTPNTGTADDNADFVFFVQNPALGSARVYDFDGTPGSNTMTWELWGWIGSLEPLFFANPQGSGFLNPSVDIPIAQVSEPATVALLALALLALATARSRVR